MGRRISCIKKNSGDNENSYTEISNLGWIEDGYSLQQTSTRLEMYNFVNDGGNAYVKDSSGDKAILIAKISPKGTKYVKTKADYTMNDNLLKLPNCN